MTADNERSNAGPSSTGGADELQGFSPLYYTFRLGLRTGLRLFWKWRRYGLEHMPDQGPVILAANHASFLDPMILGAAFDREVHFMARKTLFDIPFFGWLISKVNAFPVERTGDPRAAMRAMGARLARGQVVLMFPEGTRTHTGFLGELKRGVGSLAVRYGAAVLPAYVCGSYDSWSRYRPFFQFWPVTVEVGEPIHPRASEERAGRKAEERRVFAQVADRLRALELRAFERAGRAQILSERGDARG